MQRSFFSVGLVLAWLVTPESLRLVDRASGISGLLNIFSLGCGVALGLAAYFQIHNPQLAAAGYNNDYKVLRGTFGKTFGLAALLSGRIPLLFLASTGMLVTAGYAFNEIFFYWFPNFLFAFILLGVVTILNMSGKSWVYGSQSLFVLLTITGLLTLVVLGAGHESSVAVSNTGQQRGFTTSLFALGCLSFLGFDFLPVKQDRTIVVFSMLSGFVILVLWVITALKFAAPGVLAESSIAHMLVARTIAGESGRFVMGGVVIFGVLSGVNGLFIVVRRAFKHLSEEGMIPQRLTQNWLLTMVLSATVGIMMLTGFAGEQILEARIKASVILWLVYLSLRGFAASSLVKYDNSVEKYLGYTIPGIYLLAGVVLTVTSAQMEYISKFILIVFMGTVILSSMWTAIYSDKKSKDPISRRR